MQRVQCSWGLRILLLLAVVFALSNATAAPWPEGYVLHEGSQSPGAQYGILVQSTDQGAEAPDNAFTFLADLNSKEVLGQIKGGTYFQGQNHEDLYVAWAPDSKWCVITFDGRFGFDTISVVKIKETGLEETELGTRLHDTLGSVVAKCTGDPDQKGVGPAYVRIHPDRKLQLRAAVTTNPKSLEDRKTCCALFQGTFDVDTGKWIVCDVRALNEGDFDSSVAVYGDSPAEGSTFPADQERAAFLDQTMNEVYSFLRSILPKQRFARIQEEQRAWLKTRDAAGSVFAQCALMEKRINALRELAW